MEQLVLGIFQEQLAKVRVFFVATCHDGCGYTTILSL
jgi:hypothetical protein